MRNRLVVRFTLAQKNVRNTVPAKSTLTKNLQNNEATLPVSSWEKSISTSLRKGRQIHECIMLQTRASTSKSEHLLEVVGF